jgi:hypothetical protein
MIGRAMRDESRSWPANNERDDLNAQPSNQRTMKKLTSALVLAVFGFNCWFAWAMLTLLLLDVRDAHNRVLPSFTNLRISLRPLLVVLPIVAAAYGPWLWFHKAEHGPAGWGGFIVITMTVLILFVFPAMLTSYWLILDPSVSVALREPVALGR